MKLKYSTLKIVIVPIHHKGILSRHKANTVCLHENGAKWSGKTSSHMAHAVLPLIGNFPQISGPNAWPNELSYYFENQAKS